MITFRFRPAQIIMVLLALTLTGFMVSSFFASVSASEKQSGVFELSGTVSRPDREGSSMKPSGIQLYLYKMGNYKQHIATTNEKGKYTFSGIPAERYYILVAVSNLKYMTTEKQTVYTTVMINGTPTPSPTQIDVSVEKNMGFSWHKMIDIRKAGTYKLDLNANNADEFFDDETEPNFSKRREAFKNITNAAPVEE